MEGGKWNQPEPGRVAMACGPPVTCLSIVIQSEIWTIWKPTPWGLLLKHTQIFAFQWPKGSAKSIFNGFLFSQASKLHLENISLTPSSSTQLFSLWSNQKKVASEHDGFLWSIPCVQKVVHHCSWKRMSSSGLSSFKTLRPPGKTTGKLFFASMYHPPSPAQCAAQRRFSVSIWWLIN